MTMGKFLGEIIIVSKTEIFGKLSKKGRRSLEGKTSEWESVKVMKKVVIWGKICPGEWESVKDMRETVIWGKICPIWKERYAQYDRKDMPNEGSGDLRKDMLKPPSSLKLPLAALLLPALGKLTPGTIMMYMGSQWILMICFFHFLAAPYWCSSSAQRYSSDSEIFCQHAKF